MKIRMAQASLLLMGLAATAAFWSVASDDVDFDMLSCCPGEDAATQARFVWHASCGDSPDESCILHCAKASGFGGAGAAVPPEKTLKPVAFRDPDADYVRFEAEISGLEPGTEYVYWAECCGEQSRRQKFRTGGEDGSFNFLWLSDVHAHPRHPDKMKTVEKLRQDAEERTASSGGIDMVLFSGDSVKYGARYDNWRQWNGAPAVAGCMFAAVPGNKEYYYEGRSTFFDSKWYLAVKNNPPNGPAAVDQECCYWFMREKVLFVGIDSLVHKGSRMSMYGKRDEVLTAQTNWFDKVVSSQRGKFRYLIVFQHDPWFVYYAKNGRFDKSRGNYDVWRHVFDKHKVDLALSGDAHNYMRSKPLRGDAGNAEGTVYMVAGEISATNYSAVVTKDVSACGSDEAAKYIDCMGATDASCGAAWIEVRPGSLKVTEFWDKWQNPGFRLYDSFEIAPKNRDRAFEAAVWRGETAYVDIPAEAAEAMELQNGVARDGVSLALAYYEDVPYEMQPDGVDMRTRPDVLREWERGKTPAVCKITASAGAKAGKLSFGPMELTVVDRVLPPANEWKYFLDLWQHPWAVARYFNVEPFSKEHYAKMEKVWRALAGCGCKALTVTILDLPWNNQCYDAYHSMIGRVKNADGTWMFDYRLFDEYVEFGRRCGLGPDIACYTMCPWGGMAAWEDGKGGVRRERLLPGTPEFDDYWGDFLVDFGRHLKEKGWFDDVFVAMDERSPDEVRKIVDLIRRKCPGMKVAMAGDRSPDEFSGIAIDNYSQGLVHLGMHPKLFDELEPRRKAGFKTTFYVCCTAAHPNTFMESPADEGFWLGAYPVMAGFDGFLRWAANSWPENPYKDASFKTRNWKAGDTFLVYPGGELSSRLVALRAGVIAAEKMLIMKRESGAGTDVDAAIKRLAGPFGYKGALHDAFDYQAFRRGVEAFVNGRQSDNFGGEGSRTPVRNGITRASTRVSNR